MNSPTIFLESPFLPDKNFATAFGVKSTNSFLRRYSSPLSGFMLNMLRPTLYWRLLSVSASSLGLSSEGS